MSVSDEVQTTSVRVVRSTAQGRGTQGLPELRLLVEGALHTAFPHRVWVLGRVARARGEHGVGLHVTLAATHDDEEPFELACLLTDDVLAQVEEVLDRVHDTEVADLVAEERLVRAGGLLRYDPVRATLVLHVSELDPAPALRALEEDREAARAALRSQGLVGRQRSRTCGTAPLVVGLVGGDDGAVARARALLEASPYAVQVRAGTAPLHGTSAGAALAHRVREAGLNSDVVLLVREAGRPFSLGVFDAPEVSAAVAHATVPVVCGLSGDGVATAADDVAHAALAGPEAAVAWVLERLDGARAALREAAGEVREQADAALARAREDLRAEREQVRATGEQARERAAVVRAKVRLRALVAAAVLAVAFVVAAVVLGEPLLLAGVAAVAVVLLAAALWSRVMTRRGGRPVSQQDEEFTAVLARLRQVRGELAATSSPETVHRLRTQAEGLVAQAEKVLEQRPVS